MRSTPAVQLRHSSLSMSLSIQYGYLSGSMLNIVHGCVLPGRASPSTSPFLFRVPAESFLHWSVFLDSCAMTTVWERRWLNDCCKVLCWHLFLISSSVTMSFQQIQRILLRHRRWAASVVWLCDSPSQKYNVQGAAKKVIPCRNLLIFKQPLWIFWWNFAILFTVHIDIQLANIV